MNIGFDNRQVPGIPHNKMFVEVKENTVIIYKSGNRVEFTEKEIKKLKKMLDNLPQR